MYNQFTAIDQKTVPLGKIILNPKQIPKANRKKKKKLHSKNPYRIKKIKLRGEQAMAQKFVDGLMLLKMLHIQHPKQIVTANISYRRIVEMNADHLEYFTSMIELNCSENYIPLQQLRKLPVVQNINISHNQIKTFNLENGGFRKLRKLNLSFNQVEPGSILQLTLLDGLIDLDLSYNDLEQLPQSMDQFGKLKKLNLQGNKFRSDHKAASFWASLAIIPNLQILSVCRNKIRGIHTQKLSAGNFANLKELDFSYNIVQNQHNLICARNFTCLKKLYITGNPFVQINQYKGLQMEIYARTGAEVIVEKVNPYYLKADRQRKPEIKFEKIVTIKTDTFMKKKNVLFGVQLPADGTDDDQLFSSQTQGEQLQPQIEESSEEEDDQQIEEPMFVTEQINQGKKKGSKKKSKQPTNLDKVVSESQYSVNNQSSSQNQYNEERQGDQQSIIDQVSVGGRLTKHLMEKSSSLGGSGRLNRSQMSQGRTSSIQYGQFHKVAAELLGDQTEYKKSFDIHTSYKALKKALDRVDDF